MYKFNPFHQIIRVIVIGVFTSLFVQCIPPPAVNYTSMPSSIYDVYMYPIGERGLRYAHLDRDSMTIPEGQSMTMAAGEKIGSIAVPPAVKTQRYQAALDSAESLYMDGHYEEAAALLEPAVQGEPENLFLLEALARSYFWILSERDRSYQLYTRLVTMQTGKALQDQPRVPPPVVIDCWLREAYWKLGGLQLDRQEWEAAILNITRALIIGMEQQPPLHEQALSFLTEAYFYANNYPFAWYVGLYTRQLYPENQYVLPYLREIQAYYRNN